ncbi:GNAT family N-acetyltransferase [Ruania halotolerans]|uniref:GNAT family N-acetyltransferase n=1 Tax=Ruania halotolerans TaxID=2897773 RepID=UPI001E3EF5B7|nr:GNAT family N-acetyltransferase [Ruania halotolerans]UFU05531.1 acetyltransferase [Ruania halotolerans]
MIDHQILREDDPRVTALAAAGWTVTATSWGAEARLDRADRSRLQQLIDRVPDGLRVRALTAADVPQVLALDASTLMDYPGGVATVHEPLTAQRARPAPERFGVGAFAPHGILVGMSWVDITNRRAETDFTVTAPQWRRRGLATAMKAAALLALGDAGITIVRTGGAGENTGSIKVNQAVGFVVDERWLTLRPPDTQAPGRGHSAPAAARFERFD